MSPSFLPQPKEADVTSDDDVDDVDIDDDDEEDDDDDKMEEQENSPKNVVKEKVVDQKSKSLGSTKVTEKKPSAKKSGLHRVSFVSPKERFGLSYPRHEQSPISLSFSTPFPINRTYFLCFASTDGTARNFPC